MFEQQEPPTWDQTDLPGQLWSIAAKLHGLSELIKYQDREPALNEGEVNYGIGAIVGEAACQLDKLREGLDCDFEEE